MPGKKTQKGKRGYMKPYRRRYRRRRYRVNPMGNPSGFSTIPRIAKLRYCDVIQLTSLAGLLGSYSFRSNSVFDPDATGTGHQPMGFGTWENLYRGYIVLGSKISVYPSTSSSVTDDYTVGVYLSENQTPAYSSASEFTEAGKGTVRTYIGRQSRVAPIYSTYSAKRFFNITDIKDNVDRIGAGVTANPSSQSYFVLWQQDVAGADSIAINYRVVIEYVVLFTEPQNEPAA